MMNTLEPVALAADNPATPAVKTCPFCAGEARLRAGEAREEVWIQCDCCEVRTPAGNSDRVLRVWNVRRGTTAYYGGLATRGVRSKKKYWASIRNLRKARAVLMGRRIFPNADQTLADLDALRQRELAQIQATREAVRAALRQRVGLREQRTSPLVETNAASTALTL